MNQVKPRCNSGEGHCCNMQTQALCWKINIYGCIDQLKHECTSDTTVRMPCPNMKQDLKPCINEVTMKLQWTCIQQKKQCQEYMYSRQSGNTVQVNQVQMVETVATQSETAVTRWRWNQKCTQANPVPTWTKTRRKINMNAPRLNATQWHLHIVNQRGTWNSTGQRLTSMPKHITVYVHIYEDQYHL